MEIVGFRDGFRGLAEDQRMRLDKRTLAGILTIGGTILGTSRDKPHRMEINGEVRDMTDAIAATYRRHKLTRWSASAAAARTKRTAPDRKRAQHHHTAQND